jgi:hypothetical protein
MNKKRIWFGIISGILAFILCLVGGVIVIAVGPEDSGIWLGIGLYFIGQAFFAGPMLIIVSLPKSKE